MINNDLNGVRFLTFESFDPTRVIHGIFMRHGGISPSPWDSLNFGSSVGDDINNVLENQRCAFMCLGLDFKNSYNVHQIHSNNLVIANAPKPGGLPYEKADIILTDQPGVVLVLRFADCVPMMFYDPEHQAIAIAHAGWRGTVKCVAKTVVDAMSQQYHTDPAKLIATIGPSVGPEHYSVGNEVVDQFVDLYKGDAYSLFTNSKGEIYLDLWKANRMQLEQVGVREIETSEICTVCHGEDWYSHRGEHGKTGRFGAVITLRK